MHREFIKAVIIPSSPSLTAIIANGNIQHKSKIFSTVLSLKSITEKYCEVIGKEYSFYPTEKEEFIAKCLKGDKTAVDVLGSSVAILGRFLWSLTELLDIICSYYGYVWWIDKNKRFHAAETIAVTESDIQINLNMTNSLGIIDATFAESLEEYRNVQYISLNANTQYAFVENEDAIEAMKAYIGSGEFSKVGRKSRIIDHDHGKGLAAKMLANFNEPPMFIRFTEDFSEGDISLFSRVTVSSTFLNGTKPFVVTGIVRNYRYGKIFTTVTGYAFSGTAYMPIINTLKTVSFTI